MRDFTMDFRHIFAEPTYGLFNDIINFESQLIVFRNLVIIPTYNEKENIIKIIDENQKLVDEARERLLKQHGGFKGLLDYFVRQDELRLRREKARKKKAAAKSQRRKPAARSS